MTTNSGIFIGPNTQTHWESQEKQNTALGTVVGDGNIISYNINIVHDNDLIDMPVTKHAGAETKKKENGDNHSVD
ncbi:hypothetical protein SAMN04487936_10878 [Halobacillus dabanensis]|uniref:Spore germination protein gerPA/gerPF n=1 Tax=Halobacillus dabanensis TaxID=240302 RepID=A0A1I3XAY4_HALDA|nr:hypothetical protein [Halobacillus dabanensis]SFK16201.1 hypothetical protein SAMN04487936_10878 [Halobacillus dabanensis]